MNPKRASPVGAIIRNVREREGMSRADLARGLNYSQSYISRVESGDRLITREFAKAVLKLQRLQLSEDEKKVLICEALGVQLPGLSLKQ